MSMRLRHNKTAEELYLLKYISPDPEFAAQSRRAILALAHHTPSRMPFFLFFRPFAVGTLIFAVALMGLTYFIGIGTRSRVAYTSLNQDKLTREIERLTIAIELPEIEYRESLNEAVASALEEIQNDEIYHLNIDLLNAEQKRFEDDNRPEEEINELLKRILF